MPTVNATEKQKSGKRAKPETSTPVAAKLEAVACGISTVEREFLANTVMADGRTMEEWAEPQLERMYLSGAMPPMLPMIEAKK